MYDRTKGVDGFISFECTPDLADDTAATIAQPRDLWRRLAQPNVMIKVPGTMGGQPAIEQLTREGVNINVTLLFSVERYEEVIDAYMRGLAARAAAGEPVDTITSVASFFLSRIDAKVDRQLPEDSPLRGQVALASARVPYQRYLARFAGSDWERIAGLGAKRQRPLWASTGTKNPDYSDVLYVAQLIGPDIVNTMPDKTLRAFADHGEVKPTLAADTAGAELPSPTRRPPASTSRRSPRSSSAKESHRSATPTTSCSTASNQGATSSLDTRTDPPIAASGGKVT